MTDRGNSAASRDIAYHVHGYTNLKKHQDQGPLILELNARPGLNIQIANDAGLTKRCHMVEHHLAQLKKEGREESAEERVAFSQKHFAKLPDAPLSTDEANASNA